MPAIAIIVVLALGGGASFAAESAVPGDALYGVKTGVNESIRSAFATSAEAEARWESQLAARRLDEAQQLAVDGTLTAEVATQLRSEFQSHADAALAAAQETAAEGNAEVATQIKEEVRASLEAQEQALVTLQGEGSADVSDLLSAVRARVQAVQNLSLEVRAEAGRENSENSNANANASAETGIGLEIDALDTDDDGDSVSASAESEASTGSSNQGGSDTSVEARNETGVEADNDGASVESETNADLRL